MQTNLFREYSTYLKEKYGCKVYKLPISLPLTCPNRDGNLSTGGCYYCNEKGGSFENLSNSLKISEQLKMNKKYIKDKYKANKFIAYFQNYSNTYMSMDEFISIINETLIDDIVGISVSTRPDCISDEQIKFLSDLQEKMGIDVTIELGLQTANYKTLKIINRGHGLAEFIDACNRIKKYGLRICSHVILDLPWDSIDDTIETSKIISSLHVDEVKLHSLYVVKNTELEKDYLSGKIHLLSKDDYIDRAIVFLEYLNPEILIQRLIGRAPQNDSLIVNWNESWWKVRDEIIEKMIKANTYQGAKFNYLGGSALNNINFY
ncbi:MAG: TIGR01212 family radical SAM protein [Tissierellales bacterium]|nr:TIGR01212 family radical SAM protein [Tissierellales bacterium]